MLYVCDKCVRNMWRIRANHTLWRIRANNSHVWKIRSVNIKVQQCFLAVIYSEACFHFLALTLYLRLFCHLHLYPDLSVNLSLVFGSFWLASLFLQVSSLVRDWDEMMRWIPPGDTLPCQGLEMITFIIYNPWLQTSFLLISDYLENPVLEVLSKFSTSHNTANIYGSGAGSY